MAEVMQDPRTNGHKVLAILINQSGDRGGVYERVRWCWRIDVERAEQADYILAVQGGVCVGVFIAERWLECRVCDHYPENPRYEFEGRKATREIQDLYMGKQLPEDKRSAGTPIMYWDEA